MFPASTHEGQAVHAFPDVCKTPAPPAPQVAVPYPNIGASQPGTASKATTGARKPVAAKTATKQDLEKTLNDLHGTIMRMKTRDASAWHEAVDNYVVAVAAVYMSGKSVAHKG